MKKSHQKLIKEKTEAEDFEKYGISKGDISISDLTFGVPKESEMDKVVKFIQRYEWLGTLTQYTTNYYYAKYNDIFVCVTSASIPNSFSNYLGDITNERLISRGASVSFAPTNVGSACLSRFMQHMTHTEDYNLYTAYSDPMAGEVGIIYQACNFYYMGQKFGGKSKHFFRNGWKSDRAFRQKSSYKFYAKELGIEWEDSWIIDKKINWKNVGEETEQILRARARYYLETCPKKNIPQKGKYAYVLGKDNRETKKLRKIFLEKNKTYDYPKREETK